MEVRFRSFGQVLFHDYPVRYILVGPLGLVPGIIQPQPLRKEARGLLLVEGGLVPADPDPAAVMGAFYDETVREGLPADILRPVIDGDGGNRVARPEDGVDIFLDGILVRHGRVERVPVMKLEPLLFLREQLGMADPPPLSHLAAEPEAYFKFFKDMHFLWFQSCPETAVPAGRRGHPQGLVWL